MADNAGPQQGLAEAEAQNRLVEYGYNEIPEQRTGLLRSVLKRLWDPIPWMLEAALILEVLLGKTIEPAIIAAWLAFSAVLGGVQERRGQAALDLLRSRLQVTSRVRRDGNWQLRPARELVPGDQVRVKMGDLVPADCTIDDGTVEVDQSTLTGESTPISRSGGETIYSGSMVRRGDAIGMVSATGSHTYFGRAAELVRTARAVGHLDQLLFAVVRYLIAVDAVLAAVLMAFAIWHQAELLPLIPFFLVLITATVPVTMPAAFTVANAVEARKLAAEGVLVTGLSAVQEAATMDVLCIDKTGTLTQNRQTIAALLPLAGESEDDVLAWAAAACDETTESPLDLAIISALKHRSIKPLKRQKLIPFEPATKRSEAYVQRNRDGAPYRVVLGSPPVVNQLSESRPELMPHVEELAATGARVLAVAAGPEEHLTIRGLVAFADAPREDAADLVKAIQSLGIRILMVTGDTLATARAVSHKVGLGDRFANAEEALKAPLQYDGFANFYPEEKFRLVQGLQREGRIAGMTGDGVNDAPALKQAEVGIAVSTASDVAKAAAQVVLTRPGLEGIVSVVSSGRRVYRRMLTWTITKIARTIELAALLTIGYIATGFFVTPLVLIAVIIVLNDIVTITLATDRAWIAPIPEKWNVSEIAKVGGVLAAGWLILGLAILWVAINLLALPVAQVQTLMFVYLMYSAQATIYLTRVRDRFWTFPPSRYVAAATIGNIVVPSALAFWGILMAPVSATILIGALAAVLIGAFLLDSAKIWIFRSSRILGLPSRDVPKE
jgi:H+-transporting ATPase